MTWAQTASGKAFDLLAPRAEDVDFDDVATHLSRLVRFAGAVAGYSVAEHSCRGADALLAEGASPLTALVFLLHDAPEFVACDETVPARKARQTFLARSLGREPAAVAAAEREFLQRIEQAIFSAAGIAGMVSRPVWLAVHDMDIRMCRTERDHLMVTPPRPWANAIETAEPVRMRGAIRSWTAEIAREEWLTRFRKWRPQVAVAAE